MKTTTTTLTLLSLSLAFSAAITQGQRHVSYEGPFEGWTISSKGKAYPQENCGIGGKRSCFVLEGNETSTPKITGPKIPDTMDGDTFLFHALYKCTNGIEMYLGANSAHYDVSNYIYVNNSVTEEGWTETCGLLRLPTISSRKLFVGIYHKNGTCYVDRVDFTQVDVVPIVEDPSYGILGIDDTITKEGAFESKIFEDDYYSTINPHIKSISSGWNSNRATFSDGNNITFDYTGIGSILKEPLTIDFQVNYVSGGGFLTLMESSDGGNTWTDVSTFGSEVNNYIFSLSTTAHTMFCVIMKGASEGSVQIENIKVTSTLNAKPAVAVHGKQVVHVPIEEDNGVYAEASEKLDAKKSFILKLTNTGASDIENFVFDFSPISRAAPTLTADKTSGSIGVGKSASIVGELWFSSSDENVINYGVHSPNGTVYATGRFIVSKSHFFDDDRYGNYIDEDSSAGTLWWCGSTYKISKERAAPAASTKKSVIDLYAAKNEYEAFQLVLKVGSSAETISEVTMSQLTSVEDGSVVIPNVSVRRVMYVKTDIATDNAYGRVGEYWPDPLVPLDLPYTCPANENCPFWVLVYAPYDAKEGTYKGSVSLTAGGKKMSADVTLKVWNFTIPKKQRLKSIFGLGTDMIDAYHHINGTNRTIRRIMHEKYMSSFSKHRISPRRSYPLYDYWTEYKDGGIVYHTDDFIERLKKTHSEDGYGFSGDTLNIQGMFSELNGYEWGSKEHTKLFDNGTATLQEVLKNNGLLDEMYVYWFDEPEEEDYDHVIEGNDAIKRKGPEIKILLTEQVEEKLIGHVDAWCPVFLRYVKEDLMERQKHGEEAWTYVCCCPNGKRITLFIDHPADELRLWSWHAFKTNLDGLLLWQTTYWTRNFTTLQDPYTDVMSWNRDKEWEQWGNGDGKFFYPPLKWNENFDEFIFDDPIETFRLEILRDGLEDWEYFTTLKEISTSADATSEQRAIARKLLEIPDSIVGDIDSVYAVTPEAMLAQRDEVGKFINAYFCGEEYEYSFSISDDTPSSSSMINPTSFFAMIVMIAVAFIFYH